MKSVRGTAKLWPADAHEVAASTPIANMRTRVGGRKFDLPTEAQWEFAARAGSGAALTTGKNLNSTDTDHQLDTLGRYDKNNGASDNASESAWIRENDDSTGTSKVGIYMPNRWGIYDIHGNVSDLCRFVEILIDKHPESHIFNVGNKDVVTVKEWVKLCYKAAGKTAEFVGISKDIPQRDYFCFYDYEYVLDISKQNELMPDTVSLEQGLKEEFEWYRNNLDSVYNRKPYIEYIKNNFENRSN